jgi:hypothetical protein
MNRIELQRFCFVETHLSARPDIQRPFGRGPYTIATNGHILVRVPRADPDAPTDGPDTSTIEQHIRSINLSPLPVIDLPPPGECPECKGSGTVRIHKSCDGNGCGTCREFGVVSCAADNADAETCATCEGQKAAWPRDAAVYLSPVVSIAPRYYRLLASLPKIRVDLQTYSQYRAPPMSFAFDGGDGLICHLCVGQNNSAPCYAARPTPTDGAEQP